MITSVNLEEKRIVCLLFNQILCVLNFLVIKKVQNNKIPSLSSFSDYLFKFLIIGSAGSGKSCLLHHFIENKCEF